MTAKTPFPQVGGHTRGPWSDGDVWPDAETKDWCGAIASADGFVANTLQSANRPRAVAQANARLIAAAPELLEALRDMLTCSQPQDSSKPGFVYVTEAQEKAANAIKKATQP